MMACSAVTAMSRLPVVLSTRIYPSRRQYDGFIHPFADADCL